MSQPSKYLPQLSKIKEEQKEVWELPPTKVTMVLWETICIDLIGPCIVTDRLVTDGILNAMAFVDSELGWIKLIEIPDKKSVRISQIFNNSWVAHY